MESIGLQQWFSVSWFATMINPGCHKRLDNVRKKITMLRPPLHIGPISVFLLIYSGLKFQMKEKILLLTSFTNSAGTFNTEQL